MQENPILSSAGLAAAAGATAYLVCKQTDRSDEFCAATAALVTASTGVVAYIALVKLEDREQAKEISPFVGDRA